MRGNRTDLRVVRRLLGFVKPYTSIFLLLIGLTFTLSALAPLRPYLVQLTIDEEVAQGDRMGLLNKVALLVSLLLIQSLVQFFQLYFSGVLGQNVIRDLRTRLFSHIQRLKLKFFDKTPVGRLVTRCISDMETLSDIFTEGMASIAGDSLQLLSITLLMLITDWRLTLVSLGTLPLLIVSTYIFKEKIKISFEKVRNAVAHLNSFVQEHITGMSIVQLFNNEEREYAKFKNINRKHRHAHMRSVLYYSVYFPITEVIQAIAIGLIIWYGAREVIADRLTLGILISFIMYIQMFYRPIRMIADKFNMLQMGLVSAARIFQLLDEKEHLVQSGTQSARHLRGHIVFDSVWSAYRPGEYVLRDISFEVNPGQTVAIVGETGAGKSSIVQVLNRFYDIDKGHITIDDVPVQDYDLCSLRQQMGLVMQDIFLFSDSIKHNVTLYGDVTEEELNQLAEEVGALDFIRRLPGGWNFNVLERGSRLSVGQRQLLSLMRVLVQKPTLLVLDEATASIDSETERLIQKALKKATQGRTCLIIAHRLSTIRHADHILVLKDGEIQEQGSHQELLQQQGAYANMIRHP